MAIPLIIAAFKVRRLQSGWNKIKKFRKHVFPLHLAGRHGLPEPDEEDGEISLCFGAFIGEGRPRGEMISPMISKDQVCLLVVYN